MTDWLPWGLAVMIGTFTTLALTLQALQQAPVGATPNLRKAWIALVASASVSFLIWLPYLIFGEWWK